MLGTYITFPELLILLPFIGGLLTVLFSKQTNGRLLAIVVSLLVLAVSLSTLCFIETTADIRKDPFFSYNNVSYFWLRQLGANYHVGLNGIGRLLTLLTAVLFPFILWISDRTASNNRPALFYGLMLLAQAGLMGVFCARDALTFYFYWELALIPVYFLASMWGGVHRIQATFKFFIYTFVGSLLMLVAILYIYAKTPARVIEQGLTMPHSFSLEAFKAVTLTGTEQLVLFLLFFMAFAIKMPLFPFHTWQPDAYDQSPAPVTMVMSGLMVKMGLFGVLQWILPVFPKMSGSNAYMVVSVLAVAGIVYASCLAMVQDNLRKLVAYSSIAHVGLMGAAIFAGKTSGIQGALLQMFSHGVNIVAMWMVVELIEQKTGSRKISELSGLANTAPLLTIFAVIIALANIGLPLTNAFPGEFLMFSGLFQFNKWLAVIAGLGIILSAVYTLNMIRLVFYGGSNSRTSDITDINGLQLLAFSILTLLILVPGVYPQPFIDLTGDLLNTLTLKK
ncbi:MAG: NuoM family protein [Ferruginibacter sp.]